MPRLPSRFTIAQLENMLQSRRSQIGSLTKERNQLQKQLDMIDARIRSLGGEGSMSFGGGGKRARNAKSLVESMEDVLNKAGKAISVGEIMDGVKAAGYRSSSANFRGIINQTLIKERKRFVNAGRGMYGIKK